VAKYCSEMDGLVERLVAKQRDRLLRRGTSGLFRETGA
jgi:hypothetical protein